MIVVQPTSGSDVDPMLLMIVGRGGRGTLPVRAAAMTLNRAPKIACIGLSSWDRLIAVPEYPAVGEQADVLEEVSAPGGTTTNTAVALARLGARGRHRHGDRR